MTNKKRSQPSKTISGHDVFAEVILLSKKQITEMLVRMIDTASDYHNWKLSDEDGKRTVKLLKHKQRIICSSFAFQLNRNFTDFKSADGSSSIVQGLHDWHRIGLSGKKDATEIEELERITNHYSDVFKGLDRTLLKRLQACIKGPRPSIYENPLQVKRLCESFYHAIDGLKLETNLKIALYQLFADRFIESLSPLYKSIDLFLFEHGMMPKIPLHIGQPVGAARLDCQIPNLVFASLQRP